MAYQPTRPIAAVERGRADFKEIRLAASESGPEGLLRIARRMIGLDLNASILTQGCNGPSEETDLARADLAKLLFAVKAARDSQEMQLAIGRIMELTASGAIFRDGDLIIRRDTGAKPIDPDEADATKLNLAKRSPKVSEDRPSVRLESIGDWKKKMRLRVIALIAEGRDRIEISEKTGVSYSTIGKIAAQEKAEITSVFGWTRTGIVLKKSRIKELIAEGRNMTEIANETGMSRPFISEMAKKENLKLIKGTKENPHKARIAELIKQRFTCSQIIEATGVKAGAVRHIAKVEKLTITPARQTRPQRQKATTTTSAPEYLIEQFIKMKGISHGEAAVTIYDAVKRISAKLPHAKDWAIARAFVMSGGDEERTITILT